MPSARICRDIRPPVSHVGRYCKGAGSLPPVHRLTMFGPGVYWLGLLALTTAHTSSPSVSSRQGRIGDESCLRSGTFGQPTAVCDAAVNALLACTPVALSACSSATRLLHARAGRHGLFDARAGRHGLFDARAGRHDAARRHCSAVRTTPHGWIRPHRDASFAERATCRRSPRSTPVRPCHLRAATASVGCVKLEVVQHSDAELKRADSLLARVLAGTPEGEQPVTHVRTLPARPARCVPWPSWVPEEVARRFVDCGVQQPWSHQAEAADHAWHQRHVVLSTGTASGKSLAYQLPVLSLLTQKPKRTALYLSPTKALGYDQLRAVASLEISGVRAATFDGDTPLEERDWVRAHANWVFTNP